MGGQIKILGISASTRQGNSEYLLDVVLEAAKEAYPDLVKTEKYTFVGKKINPCIACYACMNNKGECVLKDNFQELRDKWIDADVVIYSVPVYTLGIPGMLKNFFDRLANSLAFKYWKSDKMPVAQKYLKVIGAVAQGMHIFSGQELAIINIITHALAMGCIPVTGDMWDSYIGVGGWTKLRLSRKAIRENYEQGEPVTQVTIRAAKSLGIRAVETALILRSGLVDKKDILKSSDVYTFIREKLKLLEGGKVEG